jgi:hypothetical protein
LIDLADYQGDEAKFYQAIRKQVPVKVSTTSNNRALSVRPLVRPDPDVAKLAQAFMRLAEHQQANLDEEEGLPPAA